MKKLGLQQKVISIIVLLLALLIFAVVLYWKTFYGYFLSDDFVHVGYLYKVSNNIAFLFKNFYSNWLDIPVTSFYRPFISITLFLDYLVWGFKPQGYHFTNLVIHVFNAVLVYLIAYRLLPTMKCIFSFFTSLLFFSFPLHPEAVYWIIGRVDTQATFFYLASIFSYLLYRERTNKSFLTISLLLFIIGLGSKETVVTLPVTLFLYNLIIVEREKKLLLAIVPAAAQIWTHVITLVLYFLIRKLALGTFIGGYNDQKGVFDVIELISNWKFPLLKLVFPWNGDYFEVFSYFQNIKYLYIFCWSVFLILILTKAKNLLTREILFILSWFMVAIIPITPVIFVGHDLQGSRHLYLPSVIFLLAIVNLVATSISKGSLTLMRRTGLIYSLLFILILLQSFTLIKNLEPWDAVSQRMRLLPTKLEELQKNRTSKDKFTIIIDAVDNYHGAYFLRNGYSSLLAPPILKERFNNIHFYGNKSLEGFGSNLKDFLINQPDRYNMYNYDFINNNFTNYSVDYRHSDSTISKDIVLGVKELTKWKANRDVSIVANHEDSVFLKSSGPNAFIFNKGMDIDTDFVNYVSITMKLSAKISSDRSQIYWQTSDEQKYSEEKRVDFPVIVDNKYHTYFVPVSLFPQWPVDKKITGIMFNPFMQTSSGEINVKEIKFARLKTNDEGLPNWENDFAGWQALAWNGGLATKDRNSIVRGIDTSLLSPKVQINPWKSNFVSVTMGVYGNAGTIGKIYWTTERDQVFDELKKIEFPVVPDGKVRTYNVPVKNEISWWNGGKVTQLRIDPMVGTSSIKIKQVDIHSGTHLIPKLQFAKDNKVNEPQSVINFKRIKSDQQNLPLSYDGSNITQAKGIALEIAKLPFENHNGYSFSKNVTTVIKQSSLKGKYDLDLNLYLHNQGSYYIRMIGLKTDGTPSGNFSDPLVVLVE